MLRSSYWHHFRPQKSWIQNKQVSLNRFFCLLLPGLEVEKFSNLRNSRAHSGTFSPKFSSFRIISEMMMFICHQWWWFMAENFASPLKAVQGARKMKPNDSMMYSGSWWAGFLGRIFAWKKPPKEGISTINLCRRPKKQLPGLPQFMLILVFLGHISSYPAHDPYPFAHIRSWSWYTRCLLPTAKQHAAPKESFRGKWWLAGIPGDWKKKDLHWCAWNWCDTFRIFKCTTHTYFRTFHYMPFSFMMIAEYKRQTSTTVSYKQSGLTLAPRTATVAFSSSSKAKCLCPCICWLHQCANQNAGPESGWIPSLKLT